MPDASALYLLEYFFLRMVATLILLGIKYIDKIILLVCEDTARCLGRVPVRVSMFHENGDQMSTISKRLENPKCF